MHRRDTDNVVLELPSTAMSLPAWRAAIAESVVTLDIREEGDRPFRGHLLRSVVDDVGLFQLVTTPHTVRRTSALITADDARFYKMSLQLSGRAILEQDGRRAVLNPGDLAVYDTHRPYTLHLPELSQSMVMIIPQELVELIPEELSAVTAIRFPGDHGFGRMINPFFVELGRNLDQLSGTYATRLVRSALDLMVTMLSQALHERQGHAGSPALALGRQIREYILRNLSDETMTPASIAAAHFISLRHLYTIFSEEGATVSAWIRTRRLKLIRRDLADPVYADRPVSWVAGRWGLQDPAHFSRLFRAEFGESPSAYRRAQLAQAVEAAS
ncbi:AraC family transcriptional regulator [Nocardiopsis sp. TSRI0078]|uniref:AraC-like ligand-binding domain-containing protein n=1 Tax=unclassified Nocardiopsis TaxID=2649073 RepID=UPI00093DE124|nr:helix-turn-helix domain-containing protein [Nocardiopsis sp. TSRI0078]OKI16840.1 AraC family transcriptional regulator [Nocardiopsis sp. TSRI0078]